MRARTGLAPVGVTGPGRHALRGSRRSRLAAIGPDHGLFLALLLAGAALRALAMSAYTSALAFYDSWRYIDTAGHLRPDQVRPIGYSFFLRTWFWVPDSARFVAGLQHVLGLLVAVLVYALLRRHGAGRVLASLATVPVLLDGYQVDLEQFVMAESLFLALLTVALVLLLWWRRPPVWACAVAGLLLGLGVVVRLAGVAVPVVVLVFLLVNRVGWRRVGLFVLTALVPVLGYMSWFDAVDGRFALDNFNGPVMYGRTASFVDCAQVTLPVLERRICPAQPVASRPGPAFYTWRPGSPLRQLRLPYPQENRIGSDFATRVIHQQPAAYAGVVLGDVVHYFRPGRHTGPKDWPAATWQFPRRNGAFGVDVAPASLSRAYRPHPGYGRFNNARVRWLRAYQRYAYTTGPVLLVALVAVVLGALLPHSRRDRLRTSGTLMLAVCSLALLAVPALTSAFEYRYQLPVNVLLPLAGCWALHGLWSSRGGRGPTQPTADLDPLGAHGMLAP